MHPNLSIKHNFVVKLSYQKYFVWFERFVSSFELITFKIPYFFAILFQRNKFKIVKPAILESAFFFSIVEILTSFPNSKMAAFRILFYQFRIDLKFTLKRKHSNLLRTVYTYLLKSGVHYTFSNLLRHLIPNIQSKK